MKFAVIPSVPKIPDLGHYRFRDELSKPPMKAEFESCPTDTAQRNVVPGQVDLLKAVALLKVTHAVRLFFPVGEFGVHEVWNLPFGTGSHGLCYQRVCRGFVSLLNHGDDVQQASLRAGFVVKQLGKTN
jgi:hypothetical protein